MNHKTRLLATAALAFVLAFAMTAAPTAAQNINHDSDLAPEPEISVDVTVDEHQQSEMSPLDYYNNNGEVESLADYGAVLNESADPVTITPNHISADDFTRFGFGNASESALSQDAVDNNWTGGASVTYKETPAGGDGIKIDGDNNTASFDSFNIDSGVDRRVLQLGLYVQDPGNGIDFNVSDSDGDTKTASVDPAGDVLNDDVIADSAGQVIYQVQLGELSGTLDDIDELNVTFDGNGEVDVFALNLQRESEWDLGVEHVTNDDGNLEEQTIEEVHGDLQIANVDTMGAAFDNARIDDVTYSLDYELQALSTEQVEANFTTAEDFLYEKRLQLQAEFEIPTAYALSHGTLSLEDTQTLYNDRYLDVETAVVSEEPDNFSDIDDSEWSSQVDQYDVGVGEDVTLTSTVSPGDFQHIKYDVLLTEGQATTLQDTSTSDGGGGGGPQPESGGGISGWILGILGAVGGFFGLSKLGIIGGDG